MLALASTQPGSSARQPPPLGAAGSAENDTMWDADWSFGGGLGSVSGLQADAKAEVGGGAPQTPPPKRSAMRFAEYGGTPKRQRRSDPAERSKLEGEEEEEEKKLKGSGSEVTTTASPASPGLRSPERTHAEVFELNDTPTWLARLQLRRDRAYRSGKAKFAKKMDTELEHAWMSYEATRKRKSACSETSVRLRARKESIYDLDWASCLALAHASA